MVNLEQALQIIGRCTEHAAVVEAGVVVEQEIERLRARDLIAELRDHHIPWSLQTFGGSGRVNGITKHIEKELAEIRLDPTDVTEWIDVVILALDGAWRAGHSAEQVIDALFSKLSVIRGRTYPMPTDDEPSEHIKEV